MKRYLELDGLRGLAALAVFTAHAFGLIWNTDIKFVWLQMISKSPLVILWNGNAAVDLFFVLSGFVLALPLIYKPQKFNYLKFTIKRFLRIYPVYWVAIALATLMSFVYDYGSLADLSEWINGYWNESLTAGQIAWQTFLHLLLVIPGINTTLINPVIWTLVVEMRISLILPLFIILITWKFKNKPAIYLWHLFLFAFCSIISLKLDDYLFYLPLFMLGSFAAYYKDSIIDVIQTNKLVYCLMFLFAVYLYGSREFINLPLEYQHHYISALGSTLIILLVIGEPKISQLITVKPVIFLGHISYSFYLIHLPLSIIISSIIYPYSQSVWLCWIATLLASIGFAYLLHKYVKIPCQQIGRKLTTLPLTNSLT